MKIAVTGASGQLGTAFCSYLHKSNYSWEAFSSSQWDITSKAQSEDLMTNGNYDILINCAAYTDVERAEDDPQNCFKINAYALTNLSELCEKKQTLLVHFSTDYVFDGETNLPYVEDDKPNPINVYGESKLEGEKIIKSSGCKYFIGRLSWLFGGSSSSFTSKLEVWRKKSKNLKVSSDEISTPTFSYHIPHLIFKAIQSEILGLFHINSSGWCSRFDWAKFYSQSLSWSDTNISPAPMASFQMKARRPAFSVLSNALFQKKTSLRIPHWKAAVTDSIDSAR